MLKIIALSLLILVVMWLVARALLVFVRKFFAETYWQTQLETEKTPDTIRLVVFGDSISRGLGATYPQYSFVSRAAAYIALQTGRPVHVANYSRSGATAHDIITRQIPRADLTSADIILVEVGVNDSFRRILADFRTDMTQLFDTLPLDKTVIADIPFPKLRRPYQEVVTRLLAEHSVAAAYPSRVFVDLFRSLPETAGDFWHPNNKGYQLWFEAFRPGIGSILQRSELKASKK